MEAFSLLKYWKPGADSRAATESTAVVTSVAHNKADEEEGDGGDDGPFFDIEFAAVADEDESTAADGSDDAENREDEAGDENDEDEGSDCTEEGEERNGEFNFTLSDDDGGDGESEKDRNLQLSPADDLFFKGKLLPLDSSSSLVLNNGGAESNLKNQFPTALLKSATKIRVFLLRFKKMKSSMAVAEREESNGSASSASSTSKSELQKSPEATETPPPPPRKKQNQKEQSKFFTVKFKVEEVPIVSLFTRENSTRIASPGAETKPKHCATAGTAGDTTETTPAAITEEAASDEKRFSKDVLMQKYLKMVKPLYVRASKRYGEKLRFSGQLTMGSGLKAVEAPPQTAAENLPPAKSASSKSESESAAAVPEEHESPAGNVKNLRNIPAGLRVVCKRLGKSRSASAAVAAAPAAAAVTSKRRDDSLLEQQDGIQSAILHCKRSFNGSRESESTQLPRSTSDPSQDKSMDLCRKPAEGSSANTALIEAS